MFAEEIIIAVAASTFNFGTFNESEGNVSHVFWLHNKGAAAVKIIQAYPSCGCTSIKCDKFVSIQPNDSSSVDVVFNPKNKGGEFYETATIVLASANDTVRKVLAVEGNVVSSEETIMKQYPVKRGNIRLTTTSLNMGEVRRGEEKRMFIGVVRNSDLMAKTSIPVVFKADEKAKWGAQNIKTSIVVDSISRQKENIDISVVVMPMFDKSQTVDSAKQPNLSTSRKIAVDTSSFTISNDGAGELLLYRIYTNKGRDLLSKEVKLKPGESKKITTDRLLDDDEERITVISSDRKKPRFVIRRIK